MVRDAILSWQSVALRARVNRQPGRGERFSPARAPAVRQSGFSTPKTDGHFARPVFWRRRRDLNSCHRYRCYSLSREPLEPLGYFCKSRLPFLLPPSPRNFYTTPYPAKPSHSIIAYFFSIVKDFSGQNIKFSRKFSFSAKVRAKRKNFRKALVKALAFVL